MNTFQLTKVFERDALTGGINFTLSKEYRVGMIIFFIALSIIYASNIFEYQINDFLMGFLVALIAFGLIFALLPFSIAKRFGTVTFSKNSIELHHKPKSSNHALKETLHLDQADEIRLQIINGLELFSSFYVIQAEIKNADQTAEFGFVLKSGKEKETYLSILDQWYFRQYPVKEYAIDKSRIFKLQRGLKYKDIQKIKAEYGIEW